MSSQTNKHTMSNVMKVSKTEILEILKNVNKPTFVNIVSETKVRMNKTGNPYFDKVFKTSKGNYFIGGSYEDMVNNRMEKEGMERTFVSEECKVGDHVSKCVQYNEKLNRYYLQYFTFDTSNIKSEYTFEGNPIDRNVFVSFEVKKSQTSRQPQVNKHDPKSFMIDSLKEVSMNGTRYEIV